MKVLFKKIKIINLTLSLCFSFLLCPMDTHGQITYTAAADGDWSEPLTWSPNGVPGAGDFVFIQAGISINCDFGISPGSPPYSGLGGLVINNGSLIGNAPIAMSPGSSTIIIDGKVDIGDLAFLGSSNILIDKNSEILVTTLFLNIPGETNACTMINDGIINVTGMFENSLASGVVSGNGSITSANYGGPGRTYGLLTAVVNEGTICEWIWLGTFGDDWWEEFSWMYNGEPSTAGIPTSDDDIVIREEAFDTGWNQLRTINPHIYQGYSYQTKNMTITRMMPVIEGNLLVTGDLNAAGAGTSLGEITIGRAGTLTVEGKTNLDLLSSININAESSETGSVIFQGSAIGQVKGQMDVPGGPWQIISPPVSGQTISNFLSNNGIAVSANDNFGFGSYNEVVDEWDYYSSPYTGSAETTVGTGYALYKASAGDILYEGNIVNGTQTHIINQSGNGWNAIGNPYTSAIALNDFLNYNIDQLSNTFGALYLWHDGVWNSYNALSPIKLQAGQGFFVKSKTGGGTITFTPDMQTHSNSTPFKSTPDNIFKFDVIASLGELEKNTSIYFLENMTKGLDVSYDVGLRKVNTDFELYTMLIDGYPEVDFEHQALPEFDLDQMVIPIGLDCAEGGEVTFSAAEINLPEGSKAILEDRQIGTLTDITAEGATYSADIRAGTHGDGRFFIHMKAGSTGIDADEIPPIKAFYNSSNEIQIEGQIGGKATASVFDIKGKLLGDYQLKSENINLIPVEQLEKGIYILRVQNGEKIFNTTIPIL